MIKRVPFTEASGTSRKGSFHATYKKLVEILGTPEYDTNDKTNVEWCMILPSGKICTVYDYYSFDSHVGEYEWHIGGNDESVVDEFIKIFYEQARKISGK